MPFKAKQTQITEVNNPPTDLKNVYIFLGVNTVISLSAIILTLGNILGIF